MKNIMPIGMILLRTHRYITSARISLAKKIKLQYLFKPTLAKRYYTFLMFERKKQQHANTDVSVGVLDRMSGVRRVA